MTSIVIKGEEIRLIHSDLYTTNSNAGFLMKVNFLDNWAVLDEKQIIFKAGPLEATISIGPIYDVIPIPSAILACPCPNLTVSAHGSSHSGIDILTKPVTLGPIEVDLTEDDCCCKFSNPIQRVLAEKADKLTYEDGILVLWAGEKPLSYFKYLAKSPYEMALDHGFDGSEEEWLKTLKGRDGIDGKDGESAYQLALDAGYYGDLSSWLKSLKGEKGDQGEKGEKGDSAYEVAYENGYRGTADSWLESLKGKSAYQLAVDLGFEGDRAQWLESLKGESAYQVAVDRGYEGNVDQWLASLRGPQGDPGQSAYQIAYENGFRGDEQEWLNSLIGASAYDIAVRYGYLGTEEDWLNIVAPDRYLGLFKNISMRTITALKPGSYIVDNVRITSVYDNMPSINFTTDVISINLVDSETVQITTLGNKMYKIKGDEGDNIISIREIASTGDVELEIGVISDAQIDSLFSGFD